MWDPLSSLKYNSLLALFIVLPFDWQRLGELLEQNCVKSHQSAFIDIPTNIILTFHVTKQRLSNTLRLYYQ